MFLETGVDIVEIKRIRKAMERWGDKYLQRVHTQQEREFLASRSDPAPGSAVRFAAKEAAYKALCGDTRPPGIGFQDIEVLSAESGKPFIRLRGRALRVAERRGIAHWALSLSHSRDYAVASIIAVGGEAC